MEIWRLSSRLDGVKERVGGRTRRAVRTRCRTQAMCPSTRRSRFAGRERLDFGGLGSSIIPSFLPLA
jgi:NAD-dependent DNA ligase